jgi:hypothetical protein
MVGLRPEVSVPVALATATLVYGIFLNATPSIADIRTAEPGNQDISAAERLASWTAAGTVAGISLVAKDPNVFIVGESMVIALAWWHRHANAVNPMTGKAGGAPVAATDDGQTDTSGGNSPPVNYAPDVTTDVGW